MLRMTWEIVVLSLWKLKSQNATSLLWRNRSFAFTCYPYLWNGCFGMAFTSYGRQELNHAACILFFQTDLYVFILLTYVWSLVYFQLEMPQMTWRKMLPIKPWGSTLPTLPSRIEHVSDLFIKGGNQQYLQDKTTVERFGCKTIIPPFSHNSSRKCEHSIRILLGDFLCWSYLQLCDCINKHAFVHTTIIVINKIKITPKNFYPYSFDMVNFFVIEKLWI